MWRVFILDGRFHECCLTFFMFIWKWWAWLLHWRMSLEDKWNMVIKMKHLFFFFFVVVDFHG